MILINRRWGYAVLGLLAILTVWGGFTPFVGAETGSGPVVVVEVDEEIRAGTLQFLQRALRQAVAEDAALFLVEINTPGGLLSATEQISRVLIDSPVPTAVYVHKESGRAFSAGVYILLSADTAAAHPTASIGAAAPIVSTGGDADEKVKNATRAQIQSLAERRDRNVDTAVAFVTENQTLSGAVAAEVGVIDLVAPTRTDLLVSLDLDQRMVTEIKPSAVESVFSFFSIPYLVPLLLTLGSLGLFLAVRTGEIEVTGVVSFLILLLGLWGAGSIQLSTLGVVVLVIGISLVVAEFFLGGSDFGISGVLGAIAILVGIMTFSQEPLFPDIFSYGFFPILIAFFLVGMASMVAVSYWAAAAIRQPHATGVETMVGQTVLVKQTIDPRGVVWYDGERYTARSRTGEQLTAGDTVTIARMDGNVAVVEKRE